MILDFARLLLFPALMAFAAASDLFTMTISNRVSLALVAGFLALALLSGMTPYDILSHVGAGAAVIRAYRYAQETQFAEFPPQIPRKHIASIDLVGARRDALLGETLNLIAHGIDDFAEPEIELAVSGIGHGHRTPIVIGPQIVG